MAKETKQEKDWEAESACDTLIRAEEIRNQPALLKKALVVMEKRQKALTEAKAVSSGAQIRANRRGML